MEIMPFFVLITLISFCAIESVGKTTGKEKVAMTFDQQETPLRTLLRCFQKFSIITKDDSIAVVAQIRVRLINSKKGYSTDNPVNDLYTAAHSINDLKKHLRKQMNETLAPNKALNSALSGLEKLSIPNTFFEKLDTVNETTLKNALVRLIQGQIASSSTPNH